MPSLPPPVRDYALDPGQEGESLALVVWYHQVPHPQARIGISWKLNKLAQRLGDAVQVAFKGDQLRVTRPTGSAVEAGAWPIYILQELGIETDGNIPVRSTPETRSASETTQQRLVVPSAAYVH